MYGRGRCYSTASFRSAAIQTKRFAEQRNLLARRCRTWRRNRECWRQLSIHAGSPRRVQFSTRGLSRNSESSRLLTHQNALRFRLRSSSHAWPSSLTPLPQKSSRIFPRMVAFKYSPYWPNRGMRSFRTISFGSARLTRAVSRISANWHKADITQTRGGLQRQPNVRFSG